MRLLPVRTARRRLGQLEQLAHGESCRLDPVTAQVHDRRILGHAVCGERRPIAAQALPCRVDGRQVADEADARMPELEQVLDRGAHAAGVVEQDRVGLDAARRTVDEDDRHAVGDVGQQVAVVGRDGRDDQAVHPALEQLADELALLLGILVRAARDQQHVAASQHLLDATGDGRVEGIADIADDEPDRARGMALAQRARRVVAPEAELG